MTGKPITIEMKVSDQPTFEVELLWGRYNCITGQCAICNSPLENRFPKDFPNEWKFCCSCLHMAQLIIKDNLAVFCWKFPKPHKILQRITLVKGND